jgi:hypothetical protein
MALLVALENDHPLVVEVLERNLPTFWKSAWHKNRCVMIEERTYRVRLP